MKPRKLGPFEVSEISLGCMNLSHAYGTPPPEKEAALLLNHALDSGYTMLDTAALYGFGANEALLSRAVMHRRDEFVLASKCGMFGNDEGRREINGHPDVLRRNLEASLGRLGTDCIDLYYLHRWDRRVPVEESIGEMSRMVDEGKVRALGLSEVSADTLRRAHSVYPISAVQTEYSLWTRNAEIAVLDTCRELGAAFVAFSPLARAYLSGTLLDPSTLEDKDLRRHMPRFTQENYDHNLTLLDGLRPVAARHHCSLAQLSLAWLLARGEHIIALPGTTRITHLEENAAAGGIVMDDQDIADMDAAINLDTVRGARYNAATQAEIDTERFPAEIQGP